METIDSLEKTIDFLRKDVQFLIDKKKKTTDANVLDSIDKEKKEKINKIKQMTIKLKDLHSKKNKDKEIKNVTNKIDSMNFAAAHKKNTSEALDKAKKLKEIRSEYRQQYAIYTEYESQYFKLDPPDVPGILFLHDSIIKKYGVCPNILIDIPVNESEQESVTECVRNQRLEWLSLQEDKGEEYYKLCDKVFKELELKKLIEEKEIIEYEFLCKIKELFTESQHDMYKKSLDIITEYTQCNIKSKRLKEKFKGLIHNLSVLYNETGIPLHEIWTLKYKCPLVVNDLQQKESISSIQKITQFEFTEIINSYSQLVDDISNKTKYNVNTKRNLTNELYLYYTNKCKKQEIVVQAGKYFRRWAVLSETERNERFHSFADFHIRKKCIDNSDEEKCKLIEEFSSLLINSYKEKKLIYRDFVWNTSKGLIEHIKVLTTLEDGSVTLSSKAGKQYTPRKVSVRTIFTKENEKFINEEILYYIVTKVDESQLTKVDKEQCAEKIKAKLKVNKLTYKDKTLVELKIEEIFNIVKANKAV
jgi:hypothetical protein